MRAKKPSDHKKEELLRGAQHLLGHARLAERLGIAESMLDAWIRGEATMPDGQLLNLAAALTEAATQSAGIPRQRAASA